MPPENHEPAPPATPWSGAAIAAGAVLAGLALGRSGRVGLAAGVAAAASVKLLNAGAGRRESREGAAGLSSPIMLLMPPKISWAGDASSRALPADWVDSSAIVMEAETPMTDEVRDLLKPKSLPLLDDDGHPIQEADFVRPNAEQHEAVTDFPFGPVIWDPTRMAQSSSVATSETVWFGMPEPSAPPEKENLEPSPVEAAASDEPLSPAPAAQAIPTPPAPVHQEASESLLQAILAPAPVSAFTIDTDPDDESTPVVEPAAPVAPPPPEVSQDAAPAWSELSSGMAPAGASGALPLPTLAQTTSPPGMPSEKPDLVKIVPRSNGKTSLPQPRKHGELPRHTSESPEPAGGKSTSKGGRATFAHATTAHRGASTMAHRTAERRAVIPHLPDSATQRSAPWRKVLGIALVVISILLIVRWSRDNVVERLRIWIQPDSARVAAPTEMPSVRERVESNTPWLTTSPEP